MNWLENKDWIWISNSNHSALIVQAKLVRDFIQASTIRSETLYNIVATTVTPGVSKITNHSKSFIRFSYIICAFKYRIVELVFALSYILSMFEDQSSIVGPGVVTITWPLKG
jgi:hypothetical protein